MTNAILPQGVKLDCLEFKHFPAAFQTLIWRNLNLMPLQQLAKVLKTTPANVQQAAEDLGLHVDEGGVDLWAQRGFLTVIRRNWDLLSYEQLLELLDYTPEELAFILKEDDFMWYKMGLCKPDCPEVLFRELDAEETKRTKQIKAVVQKHFGESHPADELPFAFLKRYGQRTNKNKNIKDDFNLKMIYSYSAIYGDPLLSENADPYPDALLADYAACGVNGVWLQGTLYTLYPWLGEEMKCSQNWQKRLENLRKLTERAKKHGIDVFLYMNEPRAMDQTFFANHPTWRGSKSMENPSEYALCCSNDEVLTALSNGVEQLFRQVPKLGGIFTISMSENMTHCHSRGPGDCARCAEVEAAELVANVNKAILSGARRGNPDARVIAWSWGWDTKWDEEVLKKLSEGVTVMAVSETGLETDCLGVKGSVIDYSISKVGPGETAKRIWSLAHKYNLKTTAKVQLNNTWEMAAVPYIPVPGLIERHLNKLKDAGVSDLMLSWTLGGYPGGNLDLLRASKEELAAEKFGAAASVVLDAWAKFDEAFELFPFNLTPTLYTAPHNYGPMNLLWAKPTNRIATMIGFPFDDLNTWRGNHYPEEVFEEVFKVISEKWHKGFEILQTAKDLITSDLIANYEDLSNIAHTIYCHYRSTYLQICFVRRRESEDKDGLIRILDEEIELAKKLYKIMRKDSRIGFEASNHYFYVENDLKEKVINCEYLKNKILQP